jgi:hypothetical protein
MEYENKYASHGQANLNTVLGSIGTAGAFGLLDNILGTGKGHGGGYSRYDAEKDAEIASLRIDKKLLESTIYTDSKLNDFRNYVDAKFDGVNAAICQQNVYNATNTATLNCLSNQVAQLMSLTKVVIPTASICPEPMARYNSWVAPTAVLALRLGPC